MVPFFQRRAAGQQDQHRQRDGDRDVDRAVHPECQAARARADKQQHRGDWRQEDLVVARDDRGRALTAAPEADRRPVGEAIREQPRDNGSQHVARSHRQEEVASLLGDQAFHDAIQQPAGQLVLEKHSVGIADADRLQPRTQHIERPSQQDRLLDFDPLVLHAAAGFGSDVCANAASPRETPPAIGANPMYAGA